ncbi:MAG: hypothetical protein QOJ07_3336, partial [Thermoleophilaceae bacterium]|nr:hypothetical protein [Thermoleophilaceae bacterium]
LVIAVPFGGHATANGAEVKLDGEARLTAQAEVDAHTHPYEYDVSAKATRRLIQSGGGAPPEENVQTTASAKVRTSHSGGEIEVVIPAQKGLTIRVTGTWDGNPLQLTVGVTASTHAAEAPHESDVPLLKVVLGKDDAVLAPADQDHRRAVSALDIVEAALQRSGFAQQAAARLFPADAGPAADDHIAGPLDWVLFQRRRTIDCGGRAPAAPDPSPIGEPVTTSDYLVLHALVENPSSASTVWNAMVSDHVIDAFRELDSLGVTTARFRTRRPDLVSSAADLGDAVGARGGELFRLGIATVREVEKPLLAPRLQVVDDVFVDQGLPRRRDFASDVLEGLESSSIATEVGDGAIFVISLGGTVDHTVVGVLDRKLYKAISSGDFAALSDTTKIGTASFQRSTADFAEVDLRTIAELSLPTDCAAATVVVGPSAVSEEVLKDEARQIIRELGLRGSPGVSISEERQGDWPFATDYLTVLLVPSQA